MVVAGEVIQVRVYILALLFTTGALNSVHKEAVVNLFGT